MPDIEPTIGVILATALYWWRHFRVKPAPSEELSAEVEVRVTARKKQSKPDVVDDAYSFSNDSLKAGSDDEFKF